MDTPRRILYCHCAYAKVVPVETKTAVLKQLCDSGKPFDAVSDLCAMSARKDPELAKLALAGHAKIVACYPRAVRWLFHAAQSPLPKEGVEILNMREQTAADILGRIA